MYDVIVVGARCAGSPTAMLLTCKGYRVLHVDKATFPSDILNGHALHTRAGAYLQRLGLLDQILAARCLAITRVTLNLGPFALEASPLATDGVAALYAPRRIVLDQILVNAAVADGAELREGFTVQELLREDKQVTGIRGRSVQGPTYQSRPMFCCTYYAYWSGISIEGLELYPRDQRFILAMPTNDGKVLVAIEWPHQEFEAIHNDIAGHFLRILETCTPELARRVRSGSQAERFVGTGELPNYFRKPYGPGWALVEDAGHAEDLFLAHGISDAFYDAELLVDAIESGLSGRRPLQAALADYEQRRNKAALKSIASSLGIRL